MTKAGTSVRQRLRQRLTGGPMVVAPGIYDAYGARFVQWAGFEAVYLTGNGVSASLLGKPDVGLVTCLYRGRGASLASKAEALGIATEFQPSVLVAHLISQGGFALGSTMAFRAASLRAIGGFEAIRDYLADDYQLGARIGNVALADVVVETRLGASSWSDVWKHQVRWSRTIRVSRPAGYFGYAVTQLSFWCLAAAMAGQTRVALAGLVVRLVAAGFYTNWQTLPFVPFRDLFGMAVWAAGIAGNTVEWRGMKLRLSLDGRIRPT